MHNFVHSGLSDIKLAFHFKEYPALDLKAYSLFLTFVNFAGLEITQLFIL